MLSRLIAGVLLCVGAIVQATPVTAQAVGVDPFAAALRPGDIVRLAAPGLSLDDVQVQRVTGDSLTIASGGQHWQLRTDRVQRLDVQRNKLRRYAVGGVILGAALGVVAEGFVSKDCPRRRCPGSYGTASLGGAVVVGVAGALVGWWTKQWVPVVP